MSNIEFENLPNYTYADYEIRKGDLELINGIPYALAPSPRVNHWETKFFVAFPINELRDSFP